MQNDEKPYHPACYKEDFHPCCCICNDYLPEEVGLSACCSEYSMDTSLSDVLRSLDIVESC